MAAALQVVQLVVDVVVVDFGNTAVVVGDGKKLPVVVSACTRPVHFRSDAITDCVNGAASKVDRLA